MREILFRGKRTDNGEWVEGYLYEHEPPLQCIVSKDYIPEPSRWYIIKTAFADWNMPRQVEFIEIDPDTVCQFTGLLDKNGKRIFEGDVVRFTERQLGGEDVPVAEAVEFAEGGFVTHRYFLNNWLRNAAKGNCQLQDIETIGNIHDNPELMGGGGTDG